MQKMEFWEFKLDFNRFFNNFFDEIADAHDGNLECTKIYIYACKNNHLIHFISFLSTSSTTTHTHTHLYL